MVNIKSSDDDLITKIAWLYYMESLNQNDIAMRLRISRQKVHRLLQRSHDLGIVHVSIKHPRHNLQEVEQAVVNDYGLDEVIAVPVLEEASDTEKSRSLGRAGALYLERVLGNYKNLVLGLGWGNTTSYLANFFETPAESSVASVVSLLGNLTTESESHPYVPAESVAKKVGAAFFNIWAPAIAQSKESALLFKQEPRIRQVLEIARSVKLAMLSIGEFSDKNHLIHMGYLSGPEVKRLRSKGVAGDIVCNFFSQEGEFIEDEIHDRIIGVNASFFDKKRREAEKVTVVAVCGTAAKLQAIRTALRAKWVDVLITDEYTAKMLASQQS